MRFEIISALNSFWLIKNNHPEKKIWLRFITTSPITREQGNPFGNDASGLEIWTQCAKSKDPAVAVYERALAENPTNAYRLIDLSLKLDGVGFPTGEIYDLSDKFKDNVFCNRLLLLRFAK